MIGDGSLSGGEAFEGLDNAAVLDSNFIVVVNDNDMSIAPNEGGLYKNIKLLRDTNGQAECNYFKSLGFDYLYIGEGNNIEKLIEGFNKVKDINHPVVVHIASYGRYLGEEVCHGRLFVIFGHLCGGLFHVKLPAVFHSSVPVCR